MGRIKDVIARWVGQPAPVVEKAAYSVSDFYREVSEDSRPYDVLDGYSAVGDPYQTNAVVYAAVHKKAVNIAGVEYQIINPANDEPVYGTPVNRLFENPFPTLSANQFWEGIVSNLELYGKAYIVISDYLRGLPVAMWVADGSMMRAERGKDGNPEKYVYGRGSKRIDIPADDVIFLRYWHPADPWDGLAPLAAARLDVLQQFYANQYNVNFFKQGGLLKGYFKSTTARMPTAEQERELERAINNRGAGNRNAHKTPVFNGVEYVPVGVPQKDMEFLLAQQFTRDQILMVFGVPKAVLGFTDGFNYANMREIRKDFWQKSLVPIMHLIESFLDNRFFHRFNLPYVGRFNLNGIQELQEDLASQSVTAKVFYDMGVPFQVINERMGLGFPEFEPENRTPPQFLMPPWEEPADEEAPDKRLSVDAVAKAAEELRKRRVIERRREREKAMPYDAQLRKLEWLKSEKRIIAREQIIQGIAQDFWKAQKREIMGFVEDNRKAVSKDAPLSPDFLQKLRDFIGNSEIGKKLFRAVEEEVLATYVAGARRTYWGVGLRFDMPPTRAITHVANRGVLIRESGDEIQKVLLDGLKEGLSSKDLAEHISKVMKHCDEARSKLIARTEAGSAYNGGRLGGMQELGINRKQWINSGGAEVRDSHRTEQIVKTDEAFVLPSSGARMMYPGDPAGGPSEVCNCRCTVVSVIGDETPKGVALDVDDEIAELRADRLPKRQTLAIKRDARGVMLGVEVETVVEGESDGE